MPLELKDIGLPANVPAKDNAAPFYTKAAAFLEGIPSEERADLEKQLSDASLIPGSLPQTVRDTRARIAPIIALARQGAAKPRCDFKRDYSLGFEILLPEYAYLKSLVKLMSIDAVLDAKEGNLELSLAKLGACMKIAQHASGEDSLLIGMLVQVACDAITARRFEQVISMNAGNSSGLARIEAAMRKFPPLPSFRKAIESDFVLGRIGIRRLKSIGDMMMLASGSESEGESKQTKSWGNPSPKSFREGIEARYIEFWRRSYPILKNKSAIEYGKELDRMATEFRMGKDDPTYLATSVIMPVFAQGGQVCVRDQTIRMLNQTKVDVLQYKLANGRYPASLKDLGKVPVDPVTSKPFKYRLQGDGFLVYAFGRNKTDDGGVRQSMNGADDDVVGHPFDIGKVVRR